LPPKQKFSREEIIAAALNLMRREGISAVTARGLGVELGCSSRPIFTVFQNMNEVQAETIYAARAVYNSYVEQGLSEVPAFRGVGMQYVRFAREEPRLFELLFMKAGELTLTLDDVLPTIDDNSENILASIQEPYGLSREESYRLYQTMWIFTHGIACLCATGVSKLSDEEVELRLGDVFRGLLLKRKAEEKND
jgi:AcrR family transcriptional regulator